MALFLSQAEVKSLFGLAEGLKASERAFRALGKGLVQMPARTSISIPGHQGVSLSMPCYLNDEWGEVLATKQASVYPLNPVDHNKATTMAFLTLQDPRTGELLALMDAEYLTQVRTASASALATMHLSRHDSETLTVFGCGAQAAAHVKAIAAVRPIRNVLVKSRSAERAAAFCEGMRTELAVNFAVAQDGCEAAAVGDVICTATNSREALFKGGSLRPGCHVNAIGAFRPDMCEMDPETLLTSSVFVDHLEAAKAGAGDLIQAAASTEHEQRWVWDSVVGDLSQVLAGEVGRTSSEEITVFKSVGVAAQDATAASLVYERAIAENVGREILL